MGQVQSQKMLQVRTEGQDVKFNQDLNPHKTRFIDNLNFSHPVKRHNQRWSNELLLQLQNLEIKEWPDILAQFLKKSKKPSADIHFQAEMFWLDHNYTKIFENDSNNKHIVNLDSPVRQKNLPQQEQITPNSAQSTASFYSSPSNSTTTTPWKKFQQSPRKCIEEYSKSFFEDHPDLMIGIDIRNISSSTDQARAIKRFKAVTNLIEKHLNQEEHIISAIIAQFENYFLWKFSQFLDQLKKSENFDKHVVEPIVSKATIDLQQFIIVIYEAIDQFYCLSNLSLGVLSEETSNIFNRSNMLNFVTRLVFRPRVYEMMFSLYSLKFKEIEQTYRSNLAYCFNLQPKDFDIPIGLRDIEYKKAIKRLQKLKNKLSPIKKLKVIFKTVQLIKQSIDDLNKTKENSALSSDEILSMFIYVLVKSQASDVVTHCRLIEKFTTENTLNSALGYYAVTLEICVNYLCNLEIARNGGVIDRFSEDFKLFIHTLEKRATY